MRQNGILAAAGLVALSEPLQRLAADHARARRLAEGLAELPGVTLDLSLVETNIVWFQMADPGWVERCREAGVELVALGHGRCRAVCHQDVTDHDVETALRVFKQAVEVG